MPVPAEGERDAELLGERLARVHVEERDDGLPVVLRLRHAISELDLDAQLGVVVRLERQHLERHAGLRFDQSLRCAGRRCVDDDKSGRDGRERS